MAFIVFLVCLVLFLATDSSLFGSRAIAWFMNFVFWLLLPVALSHIVREHVAAVLCCRSRDTLRLHVALHLQRANVLAARRA